DVLALLRSREARDVPRALDPVAVLRLGARSRDRLLVPRRALAAGRVPALAQGGHPALARVAVLFDLPRRRPGLDVVPVADHQPAPRGVREEREEQRLRDPVLAELETR